MIVVRQGQSWALAGSGVLLQARVFLTVYHVAASIGALQDAEGKSGHVPGPAVRLVMGPAAPTGQWVTPLDLPATAGISLVGNAVSADEQRTIAAIQIPADVPGTPNWPASDVDEVGAGEDVVALGVPNPITLSVASPFIQKVFAVCGEGEPRVDVLNLRGTAGRVAGPAKPTGYFPHTANTEDGMSGAGLFRAHDAALLGLNTRGLPTTNEAVAILNALPLFA